MSADAFARDAPGVSSAQSVREGAFVHIYKGDLATSEESVRFLTLAPEIDDQKAAAAFRRAAGQWENASTHPNIVSVHAREETPRPWLAVAAVSGQPLDAVQPSLAPTELKTVLADVAEALRNAVLYNTYHLDLRPDTIWVVPDEDGVTGVVDDWGVERAVRLAVGDPDVTPFTAPEVVSQPDAGDERTDVYGLGALAYFGLTGQPPITGGADLASAIADGEIRPPSELDRSLPPAVDKIVMEALATEPADRPDSAYTFKQAFTQAFTPDEQDDNAGATAATAGATAANDAVQPDDQTETDDDATVSRRAALGVLGIGVVGVSGGWMAAQMGGNDDESAAATVPTDTPTETPGDTPTPTETPEDTDERVALSFESGTVGSSSLPSPWSIIRDSGSVSITDNSSEGNKAIQLISEDGLEPIAVGVDVELSEVNQILADMYPVDVSPGYGFVKFLLDEPDRSNGHIHTRDHPGRTAHGGSHTEAFRDGEWHSDIEFFKNTGNGTLLSDISGTHTLILHTSGSNNVIWDNIRFQDTSGNLIQLQNIIG